MFLHEPLPLKSRDILDDVLEMNGTNKTRRIPFYHAEEATWAIAPLLGKRYIQQKTNFFADLWESFTSCKFVEEGTGAQAGGLVWAKTKA